MRTRMSIDLSPICQQITNKLLTGYLSLIIAYLDKCNKCANVEICVRSCLNNLSIALNNIENK